MNFINRRSLGREKTKGGLAPFHALFLLLFSLFFFLSSCADMFQEKISKPEENDSLNDLFRSADDITKLDTPTQLYIAPYYSSTEIRITWNSVKGAAYYMIERAVAEPGSDAPDDGDYEPLERFVYNTAYIDKVVRNPTLDSPEFKNKYFYRVSAFNTAKNYDESDPTEPMSAMLFSAPSGVKASGGVAIEYVDLQWQLTPGAISYDIYRSDLPSGASYSLLGSVTGNQNWYRNTVSVAEQGKDFYYMIIANNSFGNKSLITRPSYGYALIYGAPARPIVKISENNGRGDSPTKIKIEWEAADELDAYYAVYRYSEHDSSLTRLADKTSATEWDDSKGLQPGVYYYYKVQAIVDDISSGKQLKSPFSISDPEGFLLSYPDEVNAEKNNDGTVAIKWKPAKGNPSEQLRYKYSVYASGTIEGNYTRIFTSLDPIVVNGYISVSNVSTSNGSFFKVSTEKNGIESDLSNAVSPSPSAALIIDASQHAFISVNAAANSNGVYPVKVTWKKPSDDEPVFYHVQRSTRSDGGYSRITTTPLKADGTRSDNFIYDPISKVYEFIDTNETARVGRKYYYRVLSLNQLEQGSFPSDAKIGWGALTHNQYLTEFNKTMTSALKKLTYMWKPGSTEKLGTETKNGSISGTIYYNGAISGLGARIIIQLTNYAEFYIENVSDNGVYFILNGNSNTSANMSSNGTMDGTISCTGMYPGKVSYDRIEIKGGAAGGGTYSVQPDGFPRQEVDYKVIN